MFTEQSEGQTHRDNAEVGWVFLASALSPLIKLVFLSIIVIYITGWEVLVFMFMMEAVTI